MCTIEILVPILINLNNLRSNFGNITNILAGNGSDLNMNRNFIIVRIS